MSVVILISASARAQVSIGAYVAGDGWSRAPIARLNQALVRDLAFVNLFSGFAHDWQQLQIQSDNIVAEGALPMISCMPIHSDRRDDNLLPEIIAGQWDPYIDNWADGLVAWVQRQPQPSSTRVLLRFGHEFNGNWYAYSARPAQFRRAWRRIHDRFERRAANRYIEWVWCANNVSVDGIDDITRYYPGHGFVDWTAIDGYNWGSNYAWSRWKSFAETFHDSYATLIRHYPDKPVMIAETGSAEPHDRPDVASGQSGDNRDAGQSKSRWIANMMAALPREFPAVRALTLFNINKELGWSLTEPGNTGLNAFNSALQSTYFTSQHPPLPRTRPELAPQ